MIQANELRIGNWVMDSKGGHQQVTIGFLEYLCNDRFKPHDAVRPIPLTPEILEKCGFVNRISFWHHEFFNLIIVLSKDGVEKLMLFNMYKHSIEIKHLHQLQNLYHAIGGEELKYKP